MRNHSIIWLSDPLCLEPAKVGNKAANLARLVSLGYTVPEGFCIPTDGSSGEISPELQNALHKLASPWAVRSSSTAEDSKGLAFPGIFKTVLGSSSVENAIKAIKQVLASKNAGTVKRYARQHSVKPDGIKMAVIVQRLIPATCSGVAFSRNPVTGDNTVTIEATWGLGETLVDGSVTPDYFEITERGKIKAHHIGSKKEKAAFRNNKLVRTATTEKEQTSSALSQSVARNLASIVRNIERDFGAPQDIEWAMDGNKIYITQTRPITTIVEQGKAATPHRPSKKALDWQHYLTRSYTLFGTSLWQHSYESVDAEKVFGMRLYDGLFIEDRPQVVRQYRPKNQLAKFKTSFESLFKERYSDFRHFLNEAEELNDQAEAYLKNSPFSKLEDAAAFLDRLFVRATVLPYWSVDAMVRLNVKDKAVSAQTKKLRAVSYYPKLIDDIIMPLAISELERLGAKSPEKVINYMTYKELLKLVQKSAIKERPLISSDLRFRYEVHKNSETVQWSASFDEEIRKIEKLPDLEKDLQLEGQTAYPGAATGSVRLLLTKKDLAKKITASDVIVTINANPQFLPLIKRCAGIIADEGGIMSHASILAREFKKPCMVGCKFATAVLNEGDEITLDATNCVVKAAKKDK